MHLFDCIGGWFCPMHATCAGVATVATSESSRQVPHSTSTSAAVDDLGRRGDDLLSQDDVQTGAHTALQNQQVPVDRRKATACHKNWSHHDTGRSHDTIVNCFLLPEFTNGNWHLGFYLTLIRLLLSKPNYARKSKNSKTLSKTAVKGGFTLRVGATDQTKMSSATVWNGCMTSLAVWGPSADSSRLEVQLLRRLCRRSWCASDWREAFESQSSAVFMGGRRWQGSVITQHAATQYLGACADNSK